MKETTSVWLEPMLTEAQTRCLDTQDLMRQASMPAAEADSPAVEQIASYVPASVQVRAIDWIRFGGLLRDALGWENYPQEPAHNP